MVEEIAARYRSLSSVARNLLPRAEKMHRQGMSWRAVARDLKVSYSALFIWRKIAEEAETCEGTNPV